MTTALHEAARADTCAFEDPWVGYATRPESALALGVRLRSARFVSCFVNAVAAQAQLQLPAAKQHCINSVVDTFSDGDDVPAVIKDCLGWLAIAVAIAHGDFRATVRDVLARGVSPDARRVEFNPRTGRFDAVGQGLCDFAVARDRPKILEALLLAGANPNGTPTDDAPPIARAAAEQRWHLVDQLDAAGADTEVPVADFEAHSSVAAMLRARDLDRVLAHDMHALGLHAGFGFGAGAGAGAGATAGAGAGAGAGAPARSGGAAARRTRRQRGRPDAVLRGGSRRSRRRSRRHSHGRSLFVANAHH
jgi:hypothetical protein